MFLSMIHVGITVNNLEESLNFYVNILGFHKGSNLHMEGKESDILFQQPHSDVKIAYVYPNSNLNSVPIELLEFTKCSIQQTPSSFFQTSISEICFEVDDIQALYQTLQKHNVICLSTPQFFDFEDQGSKKCYVLYFKDPNGIQLEAIQYID